MDSWGADQQASNLHDRVPNIRLYAALQHDQLEAVWPLQRHGKILQQLHLPYSSDCSIRNSNATCQRWWARDENVPTAYQR